MSKIESHKDLIVWRKSVALASSIYRVTAGFPSEERYVLTQQMRRAALSVASNVAEGSARRHRTEFLQFLHIARGSLAEVETQCLIALRENFLPPETQITKEVNEVGRLLTGLIVSLRESD